MRLTIIPDDSAVYKDNLCYMGLTLTGIPPHVHALQWFGDQGWIEFNNGSINEQITELPTWAFNAIQSWDEQNEITINLLEGSTLDTPQ